MTATSVESFPILTADHVLLVRQAVRRQAIALGFSLVDQTKIVTAASELARNTLIHGRGGSALIEVVAQHGRNGLRLTFEDHGPGIANIALAMTDGYTTGGGLGLGLSGSKRLSNEFDIVSAPNVGTKVTITRWK